MKLNLKTLFAKASTVASFGLMRIQDYDYDYSGTSSSNLDEGTAAAIGIATIAIICVASLIGIAMLAFNVWMLVDAANRESENKSLWIGLLIAGLVFGFGWLVAVIYFFSVRKPAMEMEGGGSKKKS